MSTHHIRACVRLDFVSSAFRHDAASYREALYSGVISALHRTEVHSPVLHCIARYTVRYVTALHKQGSMSNVYGMIVSILNSGHISIKEDLTIH